MDTARQPHGDLLPENRDIISARIDSTPVISHADEVFDRDSQIRLLRGKRQIFGSRTALHVSELTVREVFSCVDRTRELNGPQLKGVGRMHTQRRRHAI